MRRRSLRIASAILLVVALFALGCLKRDREASNATPGQGDSPPTVTAAKAGATIDRKTFSLSLPVGWTEDKKDDMYDPDSFVFFENSESCLFAVVVGKKSAGASSSELVKNQRETWQEKVTDAKVSPLKQWGSYTGDGFVMEGKMQGIFNSRTRIFGFENKEHACVITEFATLGDFATYAGEFELLRQTFKLK